jgi:ribosomal-protein-alanine N-acetyltransferase
MSIPAIETERLFLKPFTLKHSSFIVELMNTQGWIKYIGDRNIKTIRQAADYLENGPIKSYVDNGFGLSLVELKAHAKPIGMCGLIKRDYLEHLDIGFAFLPAYTGQGYAYEVARKTIEHGFNQLDQQQILAITLPSNAASIKLLEKLGFRYEKTIVSKDSIEELFLFAVDKENFIR